MALWVLVCFVDCLTSYLGGFGSQTCGFDFYWIVALGLDYV